MKFSLIKNTSGRRKWFGIFVSTQFDRKILTTYYLLNILIRIIFAPEIPSSKKIGWPEMQIYVVLAIPPPPESYR